MKVYINKAHPSVEYEETKLEDGRYIIGVDIYEKPPFWHRLLIFLRLRKKQKVPPVIFKVTGKEPGKIILEFVKYERKES